MYDCGVAAAELEDELEELEVAELLVAVCDVGLGDSVALLSVGCGSCGLPP